MAAPQEFTTAVVGNEYQVGERSYRINGMTIDKEGIRYAVPDSGNMFLVVDLTVTNTGDSVQNVSSRLDFDLLDMDGRSMNTASTFYETAGNLNGSLPSGRRISGELAFEIPNDRGDYELEISSGEFLSPEVDYIPITIPGEYLEVSDENEASDTPDPEQQLTVGDLEFVLNEIVIDEAGQRFASPDAGNVFLVLDFTIRNQGNETASFSSRLGFTLYDKDGREQETASIAYDTDGNLDGDIRPGRQRSGQVAFEVSAAEEDFELQISVGNIFDPTIEYLFLTITD